MLATVIDVNALLDVIKAAAAAGIGVTVVFSIVVFTATRSADLRREGSRFTAGLLALVALAGLVVCGWAVTRGIAIMVDKS